MRRTVLMDRLDIYMNQSINETIPICDIITVCFSLFVRPLPLHWGVYVLYVYGRFKELKQFGKVTGLIEILFKHTAGYINTTVVLG